MTRVCRHCKQPYGARAGRGLCSTCWRDPAVRAKHPPLAPFGGKAASDCWAKYKRPLTAAEEAAAAAEC